MTQAVVNIIDLCVRRWRVTILVGTLLLVACAFYAATRFSINTDIQTLVSQTFLGISARSSSRKRFRKMESPPL